MGEVVRGVRLYAFVTCLFNPNLNFNPNPNLDSNSNPHSFNYAHKKCEAHDQDRDHDDNHDHKQDHDHDHVQDSELTILEKDPSGFETASRGATLRFDFRGGGGKDSVELKE